MIIKVKYTIVIQNKLDFVCCIIHIDWKKKNTRFSRAERNVFLTSLTLCKNYIECMCKMECHIIVLDTQVKKLKKKKHSWGV